MVVGSTDDPHEHHGEKEGAGELPPMMQPLDVPLAMPEQDRIRDVRVVTREFGDGQGEFAALHNAQLAHSLMTGSFVSTSSRGGTTRYEGTFLSDPHHEVPTPSGQGVRANPDGSSYAGQWRDGLPDGQGEWTAPAPACESYVGEWKRGKKQGFGLQRFGNGDVYEGDWEAGKFHDRGKYVYANGDEFVGVFKNGNKLHGTFYFKDGRVSSRKWEGGRLVSCQDYDSRKRIYQPTLTTTQVHDPERNRYRSQLPQSKLVSPRGIPIN